jgi:hypothetical protein
MIERIKMAYDGRANLREKYLDAEKLFRKYWTDGETRSISSLVEWAKLQGMKSSRGEVPTEMGIWKAIWRWASMKENKDLAFQIAKDHQDIPWEQWKYNMIHTRIPSAWQHTNNAKREKFMRENGWT